MFILIKKIQVYTPKNIGIKDILICNEKIIEIGDNLNYLFNNLVEIDGKNKIAIPGIIDQHIHILGGGGEGGYRTRVPEVFLGDLIKAGVTTVVGLLGTDCMTRSIESLIAKTKSLKEEGISAYCLTGGYEYPSPTVTGTVKKDIGLIEEIIGVKLALSDHRSSAIQMNELERLALDARVAGMLSGKAGIVKIHMGDAKSGLDFVLEIIKKLEAPITSFRPTHVGRNKSLFNQCLEFNKLGGYIDITASDNGNITSIINIFKILKEENCMLEKVTLSSDGNGSWSNYDKDGNLLEIGASPCDSVYKKIIELVKNKIFDLEEALSFGTYNVAKALKLENKKGTIKEEYFADILIIDENYEINTVIANGNILMKDKILLRKSFFE